MHSDIPGHWSHSVSVSQLIGHTGASSRPSSTDPGLVLVFRWVDGRSDRLNSIVGDLVGLKS